MIFIRKKDKEKCNKSLIPSDIRCANGRFTFFQHSKMKQEKSNWYVDEPEIKYIIKGKKLISLTIQYHDWQFQWEV